MLTCFQYLCFRLHPGHTKVLNKVDDPCHEGAKVMTTPRKQSDKQRSRTVRFNDSVEIKEADDFNRRQRKRRLLLPFEKVMLMLTIVDVLKGYICLVSFT